MGFYGKDNTSDLESNNYCLANHNYHFQNRPRRQDQAIQLWEQGSVYVFNFSSFRDSKSRFCNKPKPVLITDSISLEIDSQVDLINARALAVTQLNSMAAINAIDLKLLVIDFDGVLTDNKVYTSSRGEEMIVTSKSDSLILGLLQREAGINIKILTSELSNTHLKRAEKMGVEIIQCRGSKIDIYKKLVNDYCPLAGNVHKPTNIYIGNDLNDQECLNYAELSCCPSDANQTIIEQADMIIPCKGGEGVIRSLYAILDFPGEKI